jgi:hypothetical protein
VCKVRFKSVHKCEFVCYIHTNKQTSKHLSLYTRLVTVKKDDNTVSLLRWWLSVFELFLRYYAHGVRINVSCFCIHHHYQYAYHAGRYNRYSSSLSGKILYLINWIDLFKLVI